ncbi:unnamed protein product [Periconia digitata]|uniref:Uncharacterized protein n=1 Tax=Periconia digitata TaxID=1303443 RepID=A0A9W4UC97_9PLEO|nr:unnamed protein product [Periconia digitata]
MIARSLFSARLPITAASLAGKRVPATIRYNSTTNSSRAARVIEMAAQAEKPSALEATVPIMWAICGALTYTAWTRIDEKNDAENVDRLLIV